MADGRHVGDRHFTDNTYPGYADPRDYSGPHGVLNGDDVHTGNTFESHAERRTTPAHRAETLSQEPQQPRGRDETPNAGVDGGGRQIEREQPLSGDNGNWDSRGNA